VIVMLTVWVGAIGISALLWVALIKLGLDIWAYFGV